MTPPCRFKHSTGIDHWITEPISFPGKAIPPHSGEPVTPSPTAMPGRRTLACTLTALTW